MHTPCNADDALVLLVQTLTTNLTIQTFVDYYENYIIRNFIKI
jgi:hypothetical protein